MRPPRVYRSEAIVLRHRKLGEADKVLTIFTPDRGKFDVIAKGVRRPTSRKSGHLEELFHSSLLLAHGRTFDVVTQCEVQESFAPLRDSLERLSRALYVVELVNRFSAEKQENQPLFVLLLETLRRLAERDDLDTAVRYFELQLLSLTGYQPQLRVCASCHGALAPIVNYFSPTAGGVVCSGCRSIDTAMRPITVNAVKVLRLMQSASFAEAARLSLTPALANEIEEHLRLQIRHFLERDVRSSEFIRAVRPTFGVGDSGSVVHPEGVLS